MENNHRVGSKSAIYRKNLKQNNPLKYEAYLKKQQNRNKLCRAETKKELKRKPSAEVLEKRENALALQRQRQKRYSEKKKTEQENEPLKVKVPVVKKAIGTRHAVNSKREYNRLMKQKQRSEMSYQKKMWEKKKDRERKRRKNTESAPTIIDYNSPFLTKKTEYNVTSKVRAALPNTPEKFVKVVDNIIRKASPRKRKVFETTGTCDYTVPVKRRKMKTDYKRGMKLTAKSLIARSKRRIKRKLKVNKNTIRNFYKRDDISRVVPGKRYATKEGPGYLMQTSIAAAHSKFIVEHPQQKISLATFAAARPRNVRKLSQSHREYCCCFYCLNIRYKLLTLSRAVPDANKKKTSEYDLNAILLCQKPDSDKFFNPNCLTGNCDKCGNHKKTLEKYYDIPSENKLTWTRWEMNTNGEHKKKIPITKTGTANELMTEFVEEDIKKPAQGVSFFQHLQTAQWQKQQFDTIKQELPENATLQVLDFAKNRELKYQDEIKAAFYTTRQVTMHPIVTFYRVKEGIVRDSSIMISEDNGHDYHAVKHFKTIVDNHVAGKRGLVPDTKFVFSDGCASQYKSKGPFADLAHEKGKVNRNYFGSEHGKGECDADIGVVNRAIDRAVIGKKVIINTAEDLYTYCKTDLEVDEILSKREFFLVKTGEINRERPETKLKTINQSRKLHQALNVRGNSSALKVRNLSCFCKNCTQGEDAHCINKKYIQTYETKRLVYDGVQAELRNVHENHLQDDTDLDLASEIDMDDLMTTQLIDPKLVNTIIGTLDLEFDTVVDADSTQPPTATYALDEFTISVFDDMADTVNIDTPLPDTPEDASTVNIDTPLPDTGNTPLPDTPEDANTVNIDIDTPLPDSGNTPLPDTPEDANTVKFDTPLPDTGNTPLPDTPEDASTVNIDTPLPDTGNTPLPDTPEDVTRLLPPQRTCRDHHQLEYGANISRRHPKKAYGCFKTSLFTLLFQTLFLYWIRQL